MARDIYEIIKSSTANTHIYSIGIKAIMNSAQYNAQKLERRGSTFNTIYVNLQVRGSTSFSKIAEREMRSLSNTFSKTIAKDNCYWNVEEKLVSYCP